MTARRPTVYVETSVISYLVARPSKNARVASNQELTRNWWATRRQEFELYASAVVVGEAQRGDAAVASDRMAIVRELQLAQVTRDALDLAAALVAGAGVPKKANEDALHIAVAATNGLDYLLTWNCTHIANAVTIPRVNSICRLRGFEPPLIYTPQEFMEG
ncbi:MAG TPA: type II toxin-antitoxin system VapC family toxin [Thermoanaerobaculia bacterium]|nr:type II toxin-antitoxin system VapC family toxin [Thermoanaerobaculia bacterium]